MQLIYNYKDYEGNLSEVMKGAKIMDLLCKERIPKVMKEKIILLSIITLCVLPVLTGCTSKQIFVNEADKYKLVALSDTELKLETYYIKDGAKFYAAYTPEGTIAKLSAYSKQQYYWVDKDISLIPSLYKDEIIAYSSTKEVNLTNAVIHRYYDVGYSIGVYGGSFDDNGYYCISAKENTIPGSSAHEQFNRAKSDDIRIATVNDKPIDDSMINDGGIFLDMPKGSKCEIGFYSGTFYGTVTVESDYYFLQSYEDIKVSAVMSTKNGYLAITLPDDAKSGYYQIENGGIFKYYAHEKGTVADADIDMNEIYKNEDGESSIVHAQQYTLAVASKTYNVIFRLIYNQNTVKEEDVSVTLVSPDGINYKLPVADGTAELELAEVMAGNWTMQVYPKHIEVTDISAVSAAKDPNAKKEEYTFTVEKGKENVEFFCKYDGEGDIWGTISNENGEAVVMKKKKESSSIFSGQYLSATYGYLPEGTYTMTIYYYLNTSITDTGMRDTVKNDDIIFGEG